MSLKEIIRNNYMFRPFVWLNLIRNYEKNRVTQRKVDHLTDENQKLQAKRCEPWFRDKGDETLRLDYPLNENSVVFDVGGYKGEFASQIFDKYNCTIYVFEPIPEFFDIIKGKFSHNRKVKPFCFGLSDKTMSTEISLLDNSSSLYVQQENAITIQLQRAVDFINEQSISDIDLIKINIEGAEYNLLEDLIAADYISRFKNIQVQFHDFVVEHAKERMNNIQTQLAKTHELTYQYEFVWENWKLKGS
jgi:FkbM family methyltransferase